MDYIQPSSPSSSSSTASSNSSPSREAGSLRLPNDDDLRKEGVDRVIQRLRYAENEHKKLLLDRSRSMKDVNRKLQVHLLEVRGVREVNQRLVQEKELLLKEKDELAGICCFLDDDREKAKKVAREWQMFGRYATGVLQKELAVCHQKIRELEQRQSALIQENRNLKELCLMLDQEQAGSRNSVDSQGSLSCPSGSLLTVAGTRDSGDGSSNGSTTSNCSPDHRQTTVPPLKEAMYSTATNPHHGDGYIRFLEHKVRHLEDEAKSRVKRINVPPPVSHPQQPPPPHPAFGSPGKLERKFVSSSVLPTTSQSSDNSSGMYRRAPPMSHLSGSENNVSIPNSSSPQKPEAIVYAMKVLELHDQLEENAVRPDYRTSPDTTILDDKEKAMVVWRKLGDKSKEKSISGKPSVPRTASVSNL
ncbi:coiled-coil domain-containing protein 85C-like isoform X2 [Clavelina lepadiformis]|uniref:coiled-coil domain-containing protein 85C-like isoform X2 n=1 Tax=Clavelina lepadiformis TaxID=159417 RepID=UPI0040422882